LHTIPTVLHPSALPKCTTNKNGLKVLTVRQSANYTYTPLALLSVGMSVVGGGRWGAWHWLGIVTKSSFLLASCWNICTRYWQSS